MNLGPLLDKGVELGDALERQLLHEVDSEGVLHVAVHELGHGVGEGGREEHLLRRLGKELNQVLAQREEILRQELVRLVKHQHVALVQDADALVGQVEHTPGSSDENVDCVVQAHDVVLQARASRRHHDLDPHVLAELLADLRAGNQPRQAVRSCGPNLKGEMCADGVERGTGKYPLIRGRGGKQEIRSAKVWVVAPELSEEQAP